MSTQQLETNHIGGRPKTLEKDELLIAMKHYATRSPSELAEKLDVSRMTIYRRMKEIPNEDIEAIFEKLAEQDLKPYETAYNIWKELPSIQRYRKILTKAQLCKKYKNRNLRYLWKACKYFNKKPRWFNRDNIEAVSDFILDIREEKIKKKGYAYYPMRMSLRAWYMRAMEISGEFLTAKGITGQKHKSYGKRATDKLTKKERHNFIKALKEITKDNMELQAELVSLTYWLFYTGTRIRASLNIKIKDIDKSGKIWKVKVVDKGLHRKGRQTWIKRIVGELKEQIQYNLQVRGNPQNEMLFPVSYERARQIFLKAYKKANIEAHQTFHIWRHTGAQAMLRATNWNYDNVAEALGWKTTDTLKHCYGAKGETIVDKAILQAMGLPVEIPTKPFKF